MRVAVAGATGLVGRPLVEQARAAGHELVEIARSRGVDVSTGRGLDDVLAGVDVVVDVTQAPSLDEDEATEWFTTAATNLATASLRAGVARTVVLSIVGVDRTPDFGYYVAKVRHEDVTRAEAPGPVVVRATQFHEFAGLLLDWGRDGDRAQVMDMPSQPVAAIEVARVLLDEATAGSARGEGAAVVEVAGPRQERTVEQARRLVAHRGLDLKVEPMPASPSLTAGSALPGADVPRRGPTYDAWLAQGAR